MTTERRIIQIIPAEGWLNVFLTQEPPYFTVDHVPCFALIEANDCGDVFRAVVPMTAADSISLTDDGMDHYVTVHERIVTPELEAHWSDEGKRQATPQEKGDARR